MHRPSPATYICDFWKPPLRPTLDTPLGSGTNTDSASGSTSGGTGTTMTTVVGLRSYLIWSVCYTAWHCQSDARASPFVEALSTITLAYCAQILSSPLVFDRKITQGTYFACWNSQQHNSYRPFLVHTIDPIELTHNNPQPCATGYWHAARAIADVDVFSKHCNPSI